MNCLHCKYEFNKKEWKVGVQKGVIICPSCGAEMAVQETTKPAGCLIRMLFYFVAVVAIVIGGQVAQTVVTKHIMTSSQKTHVSFDYIWNKNAQQFAAGWPDFADKVIAIHVDEAKKSYAKTGYILSKEDIEKLEGFLRPVLDNFDAEQYFRNKKSAFLNKIGKSEEELNKIDLASSSKEEVLTLNRQVREAVFDIGFDLSKELNQPINEAVSSFIKYMDEKIQHESKN